MERADFYSMPRLYDVLHTPGTADEVDGLERIARLFSPAALIGRGKSKAGVAPVWLEPACGTGRYLRVLARRGYRAIGFDKMPEMVEYSVSRGAAALSNREGVRSRGGIARVFTADMATFDRELRGVKVDFAFNLINTIRHLDSDEEMLGHFRAMARVMTRDAVYAVGISLSAYGRERDDEDVWRARRGGTRVTQVVQYLPPTAVRGKASRIENVISHLTVQTGLTSRSRRAGRAAQGGARDITSTYTLRTYDLKQWNGLIERSPLKLLAAVDEYGNETIPVEPGYAVYLLKKK